MMSLNRWGESVMRGIVFVVVFAGVRRILLLAVPYTFDTTHTYQPALQISMDSSGFTLNIFTLKMGGLM